jgi:iron(III) transport system ATP-binding protein
MIKTTAALELKNIYFGYAASEPAIRGLSLAANVGERIAILGESGTGKSSLLRTIAGLEKISAGEIFIHGQKIADEKLHTPAEKRHVGMVFQDWAVFPHLSVFANVAFGLSSRGKNIQDRDRVEELLAKFELLDLAQRMPSTLSGGQLQRVACARALAPRPQILLLDEAFSSLDVGLRQRIRAQVLAALESEKMTCLLVTHDPAEANEFAHRILHLENGRLSGP